ncbi:MAG: hypothetical protein ACYDEV_16550 [Acidiferrobacter sp.]
MTILQSTKTQRAAALADDANADLRPNARGGGAGKVPSGNWHAGMLENRLARVQQKLSGNIRPKNRGYWPQGHAYAARFRPQMHGFRTGTTAGHDDIVAALLRASSELDIRPRIPFFGP